MTIVRLRAQPSRARARAQLCAASTFPRLFRLTPLRPLRPIPRRLPPHFAALRPDGEHAGGCVGRR